MDSLTWIKLQSLLEYSSSLDGIYRQMIDDIINGIYDSTEGIPGTYSEAWEQTISEAWDSIIEQSTDAVPGESEKDKPTDGDDDDKDDPEGGGGGGNSTNDPKEPPEGGDDDNSSTLAQYGDDFGKMGTYVEKPDIKIDWTQITQHALERLLQREMTQEMVNEIIENGKVLAQDNGSKFAFITKEGVAIVSETGKLITAWTNKEFDDYMWEIVKKLFGE